MNRWTQSILSAAAVAAPLLAVSTPAQAGIGDLLVAPTRVVLDGRKGAEIILNNIGEEPATYRVSIDTTAENYEHPGAPRMFGATLNYSF